MLRTLAYYFTALVVIVDPVGTAALFAGLTRGTGAEYRKRMALRGVAIAAGVLLVFAFAGEFILRALSVSLPAFRIAGGALLFLLAIDMLFARQTGFRALTQSEAEEAGESADISVFPVAIPLIAGPGALTTMVLLMSRAEQEVLGAAGVILVLLAVLAITLVLLLLASHVVKVLGRTGVNVITRVLGILLAAIAVQLVLDGVNAGVRLKV
ncbi:MAG: NAAT family transporter [Alphaproteobacteria bacterium]|nr:NAAT family transporter [Alphaproteobacteria bacterium]